MHLEYNYNYPYPSKDIDELIDSFSPDSSVFFYSGNWHDGPHFSSRNNEEKFHATFQYIKTREWIERLNLKPAKKKLNITDFVNYCAENGYKHEEREEQNIQIIEVSLPNGTLLIGNAGYTKYVTVGFTDFAIFADNETPEAFIASMNELLKYLSDSEEEYKAVIEKAQKAHADCVALSNYISQKIEDRYGYPKAETTSEQIKINIPIGTDDGRRDLLLIKLNKKVVNLDNIDSLLNVAFEFEGLFESDFCKPCNCQICGSGCELNNIEYAPNVIGVHFSQQYELLAELRDSNLDEDVKEFFEVYKKLRKLYTKFEDVVGQNGIDFEYAYIDEEKEDCELETEDEEEEEVHNT